MSPTLRLSGLFVLLFPLLGLGCPSASITLAPETALALTTEKPCPRGDAVACEKRCNEGHGPSCTVLGGMYKMGHGVEENLGKAANAYERGCNAHSQDLEGCRYLGHLYEDGLGVAKNTAKANELFTQVAKGQHAACERGSAEGCFLYAYVVEHGLSVPANAAEAKKLRQKSLELHEKACEKGIGESCTRAGELLESGVYVDKNEARALERYKRGCELEFADGCRLLGLLALGKKDAQSVVESVATIEKSCKLGSSAGCGLLATMYIEGNGVQPDAKKALDLFIQSCDGPTDMRLGISCQGAAELFDAKGLASHDELAAAKYYEKACAQSYLNGCVDLGRMYAAGRGIARDEKKALQLFEKSCQDGVGHPVGCNEAGFAYENAKGAPEDVKKAAVFYEHSCKAGVAAGCNNLGMLFALGKGIEKNDGKAAALFDEACSKNLRAGCVNLGELALAGRTGSLIDDATIVRLFASGCEANVTVGCYDLALMISKGRGIPKDLEKARTLFDKACQDGLKPACETLQKLPKRK